MIEYHPLKPFLPTNAKLLMLGSFPPPRHRWCMEFFYPNRTNMMWEIYGHIFFGDAAYLIDAEHKTFRQDAIEQLLDDRGVAIFDTASAVIRLQGNASDKYLQVVEKTDIPALLSQIPCCHDIVCTGQKSAETLCVDYSAQIPRMGEFSTLAISDRNMRLWRMPSSSRAYPMKLEEKARYYRSMFQSVGIL